MKTPDAQLKAIGKHIRLARIAAAPPLNRAAELAKRCGMSVPLLYMYETGGVRQQPDKLQKIAQVLGFPDDWDWADESVFRATGAGSPFFGFAPRRKTKTRTRGRVARERPTGVSGGPRLSAAQRPPEAIQERLPGARAARGRGRQRLPQDSNEKQPLLPAGDKFAAWFGLPQGSNEKQPLLLDSSGWGKTPLAELSVIGAGDMASAAWAAMVVSESPRQDFLISLRYQQQNEHTYTIQGHVAGPEGIELYGPSALTRRLDTRSIGWLHAGELYGPSALTRRFDGGADFVAAGVPVSLNALAEIAAVFPYSLYFSPELAAPLRKVGQRLYEQLIPPELANVLRRTLEVAEETRSRVRLQLYLEPSELANLPWEYLYAPHLGFLALAQPVSIVRAVDIAGQEPVGEIAFGLRRPLRFSSFEPLRILLVTANPPDAECHHFDAVREASCLKAALHRGIADGSILLDELPNATSEALSQRLRQSPYHVLHFAGHGAYNDGASVLFMRDPGSSLSCRISDYAFAQAVIASPALSMVLFNACHSSANMAKSVTEAGIPTAVAMQFNAPDVATELFSRAFYSRLADGLPVDECVAIARRVLSQALRGSEWGAFVIYSSPETQRVPQPAQRSAVLPRAACLGMLIEGASALAFKHYWSALRPFVQDGRVRLWLVDVEEEPPEYFRAADLHAASGMVYLNRKSTRDLQIYQNLVPDVTFIVTPDRMRIDMASSLLDRSGAIFMEKPYDIDISEMSQLLELIKKNPNASHIYGIDHYYTKALPIRSLVGDLFQIPATFPLPAGGPILDKLDSVQLYLLESLPMAQADQNTLENGMWYDLAPHALAILSHLGNLQSIQITDVQYARPEGAAVQQSCVSMHFTFEAYSGEGVRGTAYIGKGVTEQRKQLRIVGRNGTGVLLDFDHDTLATINEHGAMYPLASLGTDSYKTVIEQILNAESPYGLPFFSIEKTVWIAKKVAELRALSKKSAMKTYALDELLP